MVIAVRCVDRELLVDSADELKLEPVHVNFAALGSADRRRPDLRDKIGNKPWSVKKPAIAASQLKLNASIAVEADWDKAAIDKRQQQLAQLALKIWPI